MYLFYKTFPELKEIIHYIVKSGICDVVTIFGSSITNENPHDYDVNLFVYERFMPDKFYELVAIMREIEEKYFDVSCGFGPRQGRKKRAKYNLSLFFSSPLSLKYDTLVYIGIMNNHVKLYGRKDPFKNIKLPDKDYLANELAFAILRKKSNPYNVMKYLIRSALLYCGKYIRDNDEMVLFFENEFSYILPENLRKLFENEEYRDEKQSDELYKLYKLIIKRIGIKEVEYAPLSEEFELLNKLYFSFGNYWRDNKIDKINVLVEDYQRIFEKEVKKS
ncbi:MAG: hypothetical protein Q8P57_05465 [Candidatus Pacearchaeota archaeon]|nr:hypothetical protein [Candidatus Pacearchaeota archaeon]